MDNGRDDPSLCGETLSEDLDSELGRLRVQAAVSAGDDRPRVGAKEIGVVAQRIGDPDGSRAVSVRDVNGEELRAGLAAPMLRCDL
ncbi:hypothetical protein, partial [Mycobacterium timonense]|uniref:hypothetical protein n=1 Tax=Mycobacterium timonense TaxID=701043 RepID=UPI001152BDFD